MREEVNKLMKANQVIGLFFMLLFMASCAGFSKALRSNPFEQRIPILLCPEQVPVLDPEPIQMLGLDLDQDYPLWLLSPQVNLSSNYVRSTDDSIYLDRKSSLIRNYIENKFEQERWTEGEIALSLPNITDSLGNNIFAQELISKIENSASIDFDSWKLDPRLYDQQLGGYSLLMFVNGQIGFDRVSDNLNEFYWFVIDNQKGKVAFADYFKYDCDIRNYDGLDKVIDFAFIKFVSLRFPEFSEGE